MTWQLWKRKENEKSLVFIQMSESFSNLLSFHLYSEFCLVPATKNAQPNDNFNFKKKFKLFKKAFLPFHFWEMHPFSFTVPKSGLLHFYLFLYNLTYYL